MRHCGWILLYTVWLRTHGDRSGGSPQARYGQYANIARNTKGAVRESFRRNAVSLNRSIAPDDLARVKKMQITEIRVFPVDEEMVKAYVALTFDDCLVVRDIRIIQGASGYFVSMPNKKLKDGTYKDIAHPIDKQTRAMIENRILEEYHKTLGLKGIPPNTPKLRTF